MKSSDQVWLMTKTNSTQFWVNSKTSKTHKTWSIFISALSATCWHISWATKLIWFKTTKTDESNQGTKFTIKSHKTFFATNIRDSALDFIARLMTSIFALSALQIKRMIWNRFKFWKMPMLTSPKKQTKLYRRPTIKLVSSKL